jgi:large subunit ribosomal protein L23
MSSTIIHPHVTEKTVDKMDFQNKMVFVCQPEASKPEIVADVEQQFDVEIDGVSTMVTPDGQTKAEVQLTDEHDAQEIASRIGVF